MGGNSWKLHKGEISPSCAPWRRLLITFLNGAAACCLWVPRLGVPIWGKGQAGKEVERGIGEEPTHRLSQSLTHTHTHRDSVTQQTR